MKALPDMVARWLPVDLPVARHGRLRAERHPRGPARPVRDRPAAHRGGDPRVAGALRRPAGRDGDARPSASSASILRRPTRSPSERPAGELGELARIFIRLGLTSFGGPAAHVALLRDEFVRRRGWLDDAAYLDLVGAANLIPGPTSTEVAMHVGHRRAGLARAARGRARVHPAGRPHRRRPRLALRDAPARASPVEAAHRRGRRRSSSRSSSTPAGRSAGPPSGPGSRPCWPWPRSWPASPACPRSWCSSGSGSWPSALAGVGPGARALREGDGRRAAARHGSAVRGRAVADERLVVWAVGSLGPTPLAILVEFVIDRGHGLRERLRPRRPAPGRAGRPASAGSARAQLIDAVAVGQATPGPLFSTATFIGFLVAGPLGAAAATVGHLPARVRGRRRQHPGARPAAHRRRPSGRSSTASTRRRSACSPWSPCGSASTSSTSPWRGSWPPSRWRSCCAVCPARCSSRSARPSGVGRRAPRRLIRCPATGRPRRRSGSDGAGRPDRSSSASRTCSVNPNSEPPSGPALGPDATAHGLDEAGADEQPDARSGHRPGAVGVAVEQLEEALGRSRRDARALVAAPGRRPRRPRCRALDRDAPSRGGVYLAALPSRLRRICST